MKTLAQKSRAVARRVTHTKERAENLRIRLYALGITQQAAADELGKHLMTVNEALNSGVNGPTLDGLEEIIVREESAVAA